jgi:hypothetical protein
MVDYGCSWSVTRELIVKIRYGDRLPVIDRINLNERMPAFPGEAAAVHG